MAGRMLWVTVLVGMLAAAASAAEEKDVVWAVSQTPDDACLILTLQSLGDMETALKGLVGGEEALSVQIVREREGQAPAGLLDAAGPAVVVIHMASGEEPQVVCLSRILDETKLGGEELENGVLKVQHTRPFYAKKVGPWAACSSEVESVQWFAKAAKRATVTDADGKQIAAHSMWLRLDPKPFVAKMQEEMGNPSTGMSPMALKMIQWMSDMMGQVNDLTAWVDLKPEGAVADMALTLAEGSSLLGMAQACQAMEGHTLNLPASECLLLAGWGCVDAPKAVESYVSICKPLFNIFAEGQDEKVVQRLDAAWSFCEKMGGTLGNEGAFLLEGGQPGQGAIRIAEVFSLKDADAFRKMIPDQATMSNDLLKVMMGSLANMGGSALPFEMTMEYKAAAETIEGVPVDVICVKKEAADASSSDVMPPMDAMEKMIYGPDGMMSRLAVVDQTAVVVIGGAEAMGRTIKATRGQGTLLAADPKVTAAMGRMPKGACGGGLLSVSNVVYVVLSNVLHGAEQGMPPEVTEAAKNEGIMPFPAPALGDLVVMAVRVEGNTLHLTIDVPQSEVRGAVDVGKEGARRMGWYFQKQMELMMKQRQNQQPSAPEEEEEPQAGEAEPAL